jgi:hypothetical protein
MGDGEPQDPGTGIWAKGKGPLQICRCIMRGSKFFLGSEVVES